MERGSTLFLRAAVLLIGVIVLAICLFALPTALSTEDDFEYLVILSGMYVAAIPFFIALYQTLKLLKYIDRNKAFSKLSVRALKYIKYCAIAIAVVYSAGMPFAFMIADKDDAPGFVLIFGFVFIFAPVAIAVFAAVLQKLLQNAITLKSENDLTV